MEFFNKKKERKTQLKYLCIKIISKRSEKSIRNIFQMKASQAFDKKTRKSVFLFSKEIVFRHLGTISCSFFSNSIALKPM